MLIGFDVSRYEVVTDWNAVKAAGYAFGSTRATVGDYYTDPTFDSYWHGMKTAGILRMAYHVLVPDRPQSQINRFIDLVRTDWGELPPVLDLELDREVDRKVITDKTLYCLNALEKACGRKPIVYTTANFITNHLLPTVNLGGYPLWVANYTTKPTPLLPKFMDQLDFLAIHRSRQDPRDQWRHRPELVQRRPGCPECHGRHQAGTSGQYG